MNWFKRTSNEESRDSQLRDALAGSQTPGWFQDGCDQLEKGFGPLGSVTNPIPVNGITGEIVYSNRRRTKRNVGFFFHRAGSIGDCITHVSPRPVDAYELFSLDGTESRTLCFAPYHKWRSTLVPEGCTLRPYPTDEHEQILVRTPGHGVMSRVKDFPSGLQLALEQSRQLDSIFHGLGQKMAANARKSLSRIRRVPITNHAPGPLKLSVRVSHAGPLKMWPVMHLSDGQGRSVDQGTVFTRSDDPGPEWKVLEQELFSSVLGTSFDRVVKTALRENSKGKQALLVYALHDEETLTQNERVKLAATWGIDQSDEVGFALRFVLQWLWYELLGRPSTRGTYGKTVGGLINIHWADLNRPDVLFAREACDIMEAVAGRRA